MVTAVPLYLPDKCTTDVIVEGGNTRLFIVIAPPSEFMEYDSSSCDPASGQQTAPADTSVLFTWTPYCPDLSPSLSSSRHVHYRELAV